MSEEINIAAEDETSTRDKKTNQTAAEHTKFKKVVMPCRGCTQSCPNISKCGGMPWQK